MNKHIINKKGLSPLMQWTALLLMILAAYFLRSYVRYLQVKDIELTYVEPTVFIQQLKNNEVFVFCKGHGPSYQYQLSSEVPEDMKQGYFKKNSDVLTLPDTGWYQTAVYDTEMLDNLLTEYGVSVYSFEFDPLNPKASEDFAKSLLLFWAFGALLLQILGARTSFNKYTVLEKSNYSFKDVIGHEEIIEDIKGYVSIIRNTNTFIQKKIRQPKGVLFTGPPGTGKTLIAKALAGEAGVPFIYFDSSSAVDLYVGTGAKTVHGCFEKARKLAPCILFIDEIDAIGKNRESNVTKSSEDDKALLALLQELDGVNDIAGILVVGATNCADKLDPALLRAGRFDRQIVIAPPKNKQTREQLFKHYTEHYTLAEGVSLSTLASQTPNMTGADIAAICNEAAILSVARNSESGITAEDFEIAIDKFLLKGNRVKNREALQRDRKIVAYHEAGHAVATLLTGGTISRISTHETTSGVGGYVLEESKEDLLLSKEELQNRIIVLYAGRASEEIAFGEQGITPGAANDIQEATRLIKNMLMVYGFDSALGLLDYNQLINTGILDRSATVSSIQKVSHELYEKSLALLREHYSAVEKLSEELLVREELTGEEARNLLNL